MRRALIQKEVYQCGGPCLVALVGCIVLAWWNTVGIYPKSGVPFISGAWVPFVGMLTGSDVLVGNFSVIGGVLAVVMGLMQSAWESIGGTWHFLLYRPVSRRQVLTIKLLTGTGMLMVCTVLPGLAYGLWASTPGTHVSPFAWWMTEKFWQQWLTLPVLYLGAFQSGLSDAPWYGTRLLPVVSTAAICILLPFVPYWWLLALPILIAVLALQLMTVYHTMQVRDFS
jgi:hypothetical protein